jgi:Alginate export
MIHIGQNSLVYNAIPADMSGMLLTNRFHSLLLALLVALPLIAAPDEPGAATAVQPSGGQILLNTTPGQYMPRWLQAGGQIRGRFEDTSGSSLLNNSSDAYYLSRIRVDLGVSPTRWLRVFVQAQDARAGAYNSAPASTTYYNPMDLRQGYVELAFEGRLSARLRAGRQELSFGGERLIGPADWGMSRSFDAVDLTLSRGRARLDFLAGSAVQTDNSRCDRHKPGEHFYGVYGGIKNPLPGMTVEPYLLFKQNLLIKSENAAVGDAIVASPGLRIAGKVRRLDYVAEGIVQRGTWSADRVSARGGTALLGWTISRAAWKPRASVEYNYASGDPTVKDGGRNTFDQYYPSNHGYYGSIDQFGWKNLKNFRAGFDFVAGKKFKIRADFNDFSLATVQDSLYNSSGSSAVLNRKATSAHIGREWNTVAVYQWTKIWKFGAGLGHLYAGDYLKQSKFGAGYTYPYVMFAGAF